MEYIDEFRDKKLVLQIAESINSIVDDKLTFMEVCGGHTMAIYRFGLPSLLTNKIKLLSGPGCPVCVTGKGYIDKLIALSKLDNVIIATFGDLVRVPGSTTTLADKRSPNSDIRVVYSSLKALEIARSNPEKKVIFAGIGFETTAPTSAATILEAYSEGINNFYLLSSHKVMPPAMSTIIDDGVEINGYLCPGHVSAITGSRIYEPIVSKYRLGCVISGFEPLDMLQSIYMLIKQNKKNEPRVEIQYKRAVRPEGNLKAKQIMHEVFEYRDDNWRGFGMLKLSGLTLRKKYERFDAEKAFNIKIEKIVENPGCICGQILRGVKNPKDCKLFANICKPETPVGACMVSNEGACAAHYKYNLVNLTLKGSDILAQGNALGQDARKI